MLLLVVFRSLVIPVQAAVMNLLSIGASLGVVVAIFQWGWLGGIFNVRGAPIQAFIPVMLFAIVFGLSMDYEVFLVSRIHEEWSHTGDARYAVRHGLASTGRVITAAATIMICVFLSFVLGGERILGLFGLSLAVAVFLDAFIVAACCFRPFSSCSGSARGLCRAGSTIGCPTSRSTGTCAAPRSQRLRRGRERVAAHTRRGHSVPQRGVPAARVASSIRCVTRSPTSRRTATRRPSSETSTVCGCARAATARSAASTSTSA